MRLLVTGFGPFLTIRENPSAALAEACGRPHLILPVSYKGVRYQLDALDPGGFDALLLMGVAARSRTMRLERQAVNWVGATPDVDGEILGPGPIDSGPQHHLSTLWKQGDGQHPHLRYSTDAGDYLCNFTLHQALLQFPDKQIGFLHVCPFTTLTQATQSEELEWLIARIRARNS